MWLRIVLAGLWSVVTGVWLAAQISSPTLRVITSATQPVAERLAARIRAGEDFATLARAESIDPSATAGGWLGRIELSSLRPEARAAIGRTAPGHVTTVVPVALGFAFFLVEDDGGQAVPTPATAGIAATGSVKYVLDVSGLPEAEAVLRQYTKPEGWDTDPRTICQMRRESLGSALRLFEDFFTPEMADVRRGRPPYDVMQAHLGLAQLITYGGDLERALPHFRAAYDIAHASIAGAIPQAEEAMGLVLLHKFEVEQGIYRAPADRCLVPPPAPTPQALSTRAADTDVERAIQHFLNALEKQPDNLEVRWLLNVAFMLAGRYPDAVPASYRIDPARFASALDVGRFTDVAPAAGLDVFATAGGVIVDDFGAGRFDVVTSNFFSCGPLHYMSNNGDGTFTDRTAQAGLTNQLGGLNVIQGDYNNDGCTDLFVLRGGWEVAQRNSLLKNSCRGTFDDVTAAAGLDRPTATQTAVWADINLDGRLDLFVGNEDGPPQLFLNEGDRFRDIAASAGLTRARFTKGVAAGDFDNDGLIDLYLSNYDGPNALYRNRGDNTFDDVSSRAGAPGSGRGFATWFFDYNNDGWLDLFTTSYFMSTDETVRTYLGLPHNAPGLALYRNNGNGTFTDVTRTVGLDKVYMPMGANFGDIDNDGFLDIYLGMGTPSFASMAPHVLFKNINGERFVDVTSSTGTGELHKGHGVAFADLDGDGDEEILAEIGGAPPADSHAMRVFENPGHGRDWIAIRLVGTTANRSGAGARLSVRVRRDSVEHTYVRDVGSGGSFGNSPFEQHVGLGGRADRVDIEVRWPGAKEAQRLLAVATNRVVEITQGAAEVRVIERPRVTLGGAARRGDRP